MKYSWETCMCEGQLLGVSSYPSHYFETGSLLFLKCIVQACWPTSFQAFSLSLPSIWQYIQGLQTSASASNFLVRSRDQTWGTRLAQQVLLCTEPSQCVWCTGIPGGQRHLRSPEARGACELPNTGTLNQIQYNICSYWFYNFKIFFYVYISV